MLTIALLTAATIRALIGLAPFVAAGPLVTVLGFPPGEATASAIAFARLFGVRDVGYGAVIAWAAWHPDVLAPVIALNAVTDLTDFVAFGLAARGRPELVRPLGLCGAVAGSAFVAWLVLGALALR